MKRMILVLMVLALAIPAVAEVKVYCGTQPWLGSSAAEPTDPTWAAAGITTLATTYVANEPWKTAADLVTVYYDATSEPNRVRAFGLNIELVDTLGADDSVFTSVEGYFVGESNSAGQGYGIFPGTITIDSGGNVTNYGTPVAPNTAPGAAGTGIGTKKIVIEMGSLYTDANAPAKSGVLLKFKVNNKACKVVITENTERGGIVMENPDEVISPNTPAAYVLCPGDVESGRGKVWDGWCNITDFQKVKENYIGGYTFMSSDICTNRNGPPDDQVNNDDFQWVKNRLIAVTDWR